MAANITQVVRSSQTLIVPDIHEDIKRLQKFEPFIEQADHVVWLGDWFDTFASQKYPNAMAQIVKDAVNNTKMEVLLGNHCCHYYYPQRYFQCSGYDPKTRKIVNEVLTPEDIAKVRVFTKVGKFLVSHAGFHPDTIAWADDTVVANAIELATAGEYHNIFAAGKVRGGWNNVGGPTWLDWNHEFQAMEIPQIVGHTKDDRVRTKTHKDSGAVSYCLDTGLRHAMWTDGENVEIVTL